MKYLKITTVVIFMVASSYSLAQIQKGVYSVRGSVSYSKSELEYPSYSTKITTLSLAPAVSYFITNSIEFNWSLNHNTVESNSSLFSSSSTFTLVSAGLRLYYPIEEIAFFGGTSLSKVDGSKSIGYLFEGGLDYFIFSNIALEPVIISSYEESNSSKSTGTQFYIGFKYFMQ